MKRGIFDFVVFLAIAVVGLMTAYVSFGKLSSEASGKLAEYSFSGAFAGAIISWTVLASVYLQLRRSNKEVEELRARNEELQHKLIRGAPKPDGFTIEVDERQRIVLARPEEWQPKGGLIFDLELPEQAMTKGDMFPPVFRCAFETIATNSTREAWLAEQLKAVEDAVDDVDSYTTEMVSVGGQTTETNESLKLIVRQFVLIRMERSPVTGKLGRHWFTVNKHDFTGYLKKAAPENISSNKPTQVKLFGRALRQGGSCHIGDREVKNKVMEDGTVLITVLKEDINFRNQVEIEWENPDVHGMRSNKLVLAVCGDSGIEEQLAKETTSAPPEESSAQQITEEGGNGSPIPPQTSDTDEPQEIYRQVVRMRVLCYNEPLKRIYTFDFWDDDQDFNKSSAVFNQILNSVRFLD